jgi:hypothetical protein
MNLRHVSSSRRAADKAVTEMKSTLRNCSRSLPELQAALEPVMVAASSLIKWAKSCPQEDQQVGGSRPALAVPVGVDLQLLGAAVVADDLDAIDSLVRHYGDGSPDTVACAACVAAGTGREEALHFLLAFLPAQDLHHLDLQAAAWWAAGHGHTGCLRILNQSGCRMDAADCFGITAIFMAAQKGHSTALRFLVDEVGCRVDRRNRAGMFPLHAAREGGHDECVDILLRRMRQPQ